MSYRGDDFNTVQGWFSRLLDRQGWFDQELADDAGGTITGDSACEAAAPECSGSGTVSVRAVSMSVGSTLWIPAPRRKRTAVTIHGRSQLVAAAPTMRGIGRVIAPIRGTSETRAMAPRSRGYGMVDRSPIEEEELLLLSEA